MPLSLGSVPEILTVILVRGSDFVSSLKRKDGSNWPAGSQVVLEFQVQPTPVEWVASISGAVASWDVDVEDVNALLMKRPRGVKLWYVDGGLRLLWAQGETDVRGV